MALRTFSSAVLDDPADAYVGHKTSDGNVTAVHFDVMEGEVFGRMGRMLRMREMTWNGCENVLVCCSEAVVAMEAQSSSSRHRSL